MLLYENGQAMLELIWGKIGMLEENSEGKAAVRAKVLEDTLFALVACPRFSEKDVAAQRP